MAPRCGTGARRQHGVISHAQLAAAGVDNHGIRHRIAVGRLHRISRGVYAVGRPDVTQHGLWMAAVLCCGPGAVLSHGSAAALYCIIKGSETVHVSVPRSNRHRPPGIVVHARPGLTADDCTEHHAIPVTTPAVTLLDLAREVPPAELEGAIVAADQRDLIDPEQLRSALDGLRGRPGVARLRRALDKHTFTLTDSALERRFLGLARDAGLARPQTQAGVNGFRVDFYWPELGLVVETDGLRYHRTPAQQAKDRRRDQAHTAAGLTCLRFTHGQVRFEAKHVLRMLAAVSRN